MAPLKFCANLSWLFTELPDLSRRLQAAAAAGFQAVEAAWILDSNLQELQRVKESAGVELVLLNTPPGDLKAGDLGLGAVPGREAEFRRGLEQTVDFAKALNCKRVLEPILNVCVHLQDSPDGRKDSCRLLQSVRCPGDGGRLHSEPQIRRRRPAEGGDDRTDRAHQHKSHRPQLFPELPPPGGRDPGEGWPAQHSAADGPLSLADHGWKPDSEHAEVLTSSWSRSGGAGSRQERARQSRRTELPLPVQHAGEPGLPGLRGLRV
ncbi:putative hydroxypyruvate isomerase isoform X2 [Oryzias melastigma]|uniref:putative hydroxypyruvate isomerase isoform X2 n=1 Tax=Oryzias melastigma TaxID=30732 RepID=UPI000CF7E97B|nr:putative hydroxypyruvate isomerase isoform X2 [Oryzias melastigma]